MKNFILDIINKIQKFSKKVDDLTFLVDHRWCIINESNDSKTVFIFRKNNDLLISKEGNVEKAKWEYLGGNRLLIEKSDGCFLFIHEFLDDSILILRIDKSNDNEYFFLINEAKFSKTIHLEEALSVIDKKYIALPEQKVSKMQIVSYKTKNGNIEVEFDAVLLHPPIGSKVFKDGSPAPNGKYKLFYLFNIYVENGFVKKITFF